MRSEIEQLALDIARCSDLSVAVTDAKHPCHIIVSTQKHLGTTYRQSPEPWAGDLEKAPVLFLASNPSISELEDIGEVYPRTDYATSQIAHPEWSEERVVEFHTKRFDQTREKPFATSKAQYLSMDDNYRGSDKDGPGKGIQRYWFYAMKESRFVLGREIDISQDICLTEVVHCKTKKENDGAGKSAGIYEAQVACAERFLDRILNQSGAILVVVNGEVAWNAARNSDNWNSQSTWDIDSSRFGQLPKFRDPSAHLGIVTADGRPRIVYAIRHVSNGHGFNNAKLALGEKTAQDLAQLVQSILAGTESVPTTRLELLKRLGLND
jgi:hypothetical protein